MWLINCSYVHVHLERPGNSLLIVSNFLLKKKEQLGKEAKEKSNLNLLTITDS